MCDVMHAIRPVVLFQGPLCRSVCFVAIRNQMFKTLDAGHGNHKSATATAAFCQASKSEEHLQGC